VGPAAAPRAVVVVDPVSTGVVLCHQAVHVHGLTVIAVWSDVIPSELKQYVDPRMAVNYAARIQHQTGALDETVKAVRALELDVCECFVGCETGVLLNDQLADALGCRGNGTAKSSLRRNKFLQTEAVRSAGLNACGQQLADCSEDVERFLREKPPATTCAAPTHSSRTGLRWCPLPGTRRRASRAHTRGGPSLCSAPAGSPQLQSSGQAGRGRGQRRRLHLRLSGRGPACIRLARGHEERPRPHQLQRSAAGAPRDCPMPHAVVQLPACRAVEAHGGADVVLVHERRST
jgi:hypothetical protein